MVVVTIVNVVPVAAVVTFVAVVALGSPTAFGHPIKFWANQIFITIFCYTTILLTESSIYKGTSPLMRLCASQYLAIFSSSERGSHCRLLKSLTLDAWLLASEITLAALFCSLKTRLKFSLSQLVQIELT